MFRKMQLRFILIACGAVALILIAFTSVLNSMRLYQNSREIDLVLQVLAENDGVLPDKVQDKDADRLEDLLARVTIRQARYFSLVMDAQDQIIDMNFDHLALLSAEEVLTQLNQMDLSEAQEGHFSLGKQQFDYLVKSQADQQRLIVVLDTTSYMENRQDLLRLSITMSLYSLLFFALILSLLSGYAIAPYVENYEKQKRFITNAGHELKTPLAIIAANTEMEELLTGETEWSKSTRDQTVRMTGLINQMVTLARLEEQPEISLTDCDFSSIAQDAAEDFKGLVLRDGKQFQMDIRPDIHVKAEAKSLFELVTILVDNANKYCDAGGTVTVKLTQIGRTRKRARLAVSNHYAAGKNVDYSRFFDRFYREDQSHNSKIQGYGIGLSMANTLVQLFKGRIVVSYKGEIITFTVLL